MRQKILQIHESHVDLDLQHDLYLGTCYIHSSIQTQHKFSLAILTNKIIAFPYVIVPDCQL